MRNKTIDKKLLQYVKRYVLKLPESLTVCHWAVMLCGHLQGLPSVEQGGLWLAGLYIVAYVLPFFVLFPLTLMFKVCRFRYCPYAYLLALNTVHLWYGEWMETECMYAPCIILACLTLAAYVYGLVRRFA